MIFNYGLDYAHFLGDKMKTRKFILFFVLSLLLTLSVFAENPKIRIGINFGSTAIKQSTVLKFENGFQLGDVTQGNYFLPGMFFADNCITVSASGDKIILLSEDGYVLHEGESGFPVALHPLGSELDGNGYIPFTAIGSIKYPEILSFSASAGNITVINIVDSELYFKGVLPSEVYPSWHEEALKAAAVATRTYTYHSMSGKHSKYGFDVCATTCCQVYSGITKCQPSTNKAVDETQNQVLTYNGKLITAVYHAISGGITESAAGAWGGNPASYPYLTVVTTPFENYNEIGQGHWKKVLYDEDFNKLISKSAYSGGISAPITSITLNDSTPGYLNNMTLTDSAGRSITLKTSSNVRSFFGTLSSNFTIGKVYMPSSFSAESVTVLTASGETEPPAGSGVYIASTSGTEYVSGIRRAYFIDGKGYGHGVGMSQYGAQYAAKAGYTYEEILGIYYPGTTLTDYTQLGK